MRRDELIAIHDCPVHTGRVRALVHALVQHLPRGDELPLAYLHVAGAQATLVVKAHRVDHEILAACDRGCTGNRPGGPVAASSSLGRAQTVCAQRLAAPVGRAAVPRSARPAARSDSIHAGLSAPASRVVAGGTRVPRARRRHGRPRPVLRARQHAARVDPRRKSVAGRRAVRRGGEVRGAECARCHGAAWHVRAAVAADPGLVERASGDARRVRQSAAVRTRERR